MKILWPENRQVSADQLIVWAQDDIENGESFLFQTRDEVRTLADAIMVLEDAGSVTFDRRVK